MRPETRLAELIERVSGIVLDERDMPRLRGFAQERAAANRFPDLASYVDALRRTAGGGEWREILGRITVKESSLFRGPHQFAALADRIIPDQIESGRRTIRVWSAGCARGEEPATLAVVLASCSALEGHNWSILATDVDEEALDLARIAAFPRRAMRKVPPQLLGRYFESQGDRFRLISPLRKRIEFRHLNLIQSPLLLPEGPFDAVFLRNVLIYFREDSQARVAASIAPHIAPGGYLFVGPAENLRRLAPQYVACDLGECFAYRPPHTVTESGGSSRAANPPLAQGGADRAPGDRPGGGPVAAAAALARGDTEAAEALLGSSSVAHDDPFAHAIAGLIAERAGRHDDAIRAFRAASYLDQSLFQVRYLMARCLARSGWTDRSQVELRALGALLSQGGDSSLPWADEIGLPNRETVEKSCRSGVEALVRGGG